MSRVSLIRNVFSHGFPQPTRSLNIYTAGGSAKSSIKLAAAPTGCHDCGRPQTEMKKIAAHPHRNRKTAVQGWSHGSVRRVRRRALAVALRCKGASILQPERHGSNTPDHTSKAERCHAVLTSMAAEIFSSIIRFPSTLERRSVFGQFAAQSRLRSIMVVTAAVHNSKAIIPSRQASMVEFLPAERYAAISDTFFIYLFDHPSVSGTALTVWKSRAPLPCLKTRVSSKPRFPTASTTMCMLTSIVKAPFHAYK
jgi:hypothetical protein